MTSDNLKPPAKCAPKKLSEVSPQDEETRRSFVAFRHAIGWSQLRTAIELGVTAKTIENWEHPSADRNRRIPATAFNMMRRIAQQETACDSQGKIRSAV